MKQTRSSLDRRGALALALGAGAALVTTRAMAQQARPELHVRRDTGCGCCLAWAEIMGRSGRFTLTVTNEADMSALKQSLGVPRDLASCHTATVAGFVIEGHVPLDDIVRLMETRPTGVRGIAVAGMPNGAPGLERSGNGRDPGEGKAVWGDGAPRGFARAHPPGGCGVRSYIWVGWRRGRR
jgi:hypothetical protein